MVALHELDPELWSELEFGTCELGHLRRTRRLVNYARQMAERPDASTPRQTESWSDCKGVYRLFWRPEVTFERVTAAHYERTRDLEPGTYLVISGSCLFYAQGLTAESQERLAAMPLRRVMDGGASRRPLTAG